MSPITTCASCGTELDVPCDPRDQDDMWRIHCDRCNRRFDEAMAAEFPQGQCSTCGAAYRLARVECPDCLTLGEVLARPFDPAAPVWVPCATCAGTGSVERRIANHEETLCGFPDGEGIWPLPTKEDVLAWAVQAHADDVARAAWQARHPDEIPF